MISFRHWSVWGALALAGVVAGAAACSADGGTTDVRAPADEASQSLSVDGKDGKAQRGGEAREHQHGPGDRRGFHGHGPGAAGGPAFLLGAALHHLDLTDAQKTAIEGAMSKLGPGPKDRGPVDGAAFTALAAGVRAGKVDADAVLAKVGADGSKMDEKRADLASALDTLHSTLTKEQRRTLVDTVKKHMEEAGERGGPPGMQGPPPGMEGGRGGKGMRGGPLGFMLRDLKLTDAQRDSIDKALEAQRPAAPDEAAMKKQFEAFHTEMNARLEAFAADTFDAKAFVAPPSGGEEFGPKKHIERMVKDLAAIVPILDASQRETLAAQLEKGPPPPPGHPGERGPMGEPGADDAKAP